MAQKIKLTVSATVSAKLIQDLTEYGKHMAQYMASECRNRIRQKYLELVDRFYHEYTPGDWSSHTADFRINKQNYFYVRHHDRGFKYPGMRLTYSPYYKNSHNTIYRGGIIISEDRMYDDYRADDSIVLQSFLDGYHGPEYMGIHLGLFPLQEILDYKDWLTENINAELGQQANSYAAKFNYNILRT